MAAEAAGDPGALAAELSTFIAEVYDERSEENMRVTFVNGHVSAIEQMQH
jgi:hypothetical protein